MKSLLLFFLPFLFFSSVCLAELPPENKDLDHEAFIKELKNSKVQLYNDILKKYDDYLQKHPKDIPVQIEKCKFIEFALYDDNEEYNPNQAYFDSTAASLLKLYPKNPDVLVFHTTFLYGEKKKELLENAERYIKEKSDGWSAHNIGVINYEIAMLHYNDEEYKEAYYYMNKAGSYNKEYTYSLEFIRILIEEDKKEEALKALQNPEDTVTDVYHLRQKSELFLKLKDYKNALRLYTIVHEKDTSINNNEELARTMEGIGEFNVARGYLVADTSTSWNKKTTLLNLFLHDLKHHSGDTCLSSYDAYRELGYTSDPFAAYRLKLFVSYPLLLWKPHDLLGVLATILLLIIFVLIPYFWILPVYFIGHHWKIVDRSNQETYQWGLKSFWWVSSGYFIASFAATYLKPEYLNWLVNVKNYSIAELTPEEEGISLLVFVLFFAFFGFAALYRVKLKTLLPKRGQTGKMIGTTIGFFIVLRIVTLIYIQIGIRYFDVKADDLAFVPNLLLSSRKDILGLISTYGGMVGVLIVGIIVPVYEEIIFRGAILESCKRYITYNWALILQATLFAAIHQQLFLFPVFFGFGIVTALLNKKFGGLIPGIILHIINNTIVVASMIANHN